MVASDERWSLSDIFRLCRLHYGFKFNHVWDDKVCLVDMVKWVWIMEDLWIQHHSTPYDVWKKKLSLRCQQKNKFTSEIPLCEIMWPQSCLLWFLLTWHQHHSEFSLCILLVDLPYFKPHRDLSKRRASNVFVLITAALPPPTYPTWEVHFVFSSTVHMQTTKGVIACCANHKISMIPWKATEKKAASYVIVFSLLWLQQSASLAWQHTVVVSHYQSHTHTHTQCFSFRATENT